MGCFGNILQRGGGGRSLADEHFSWGVSRPAGEVWGWLTMVGQVFVNPPKTGERLEANFGSKLDWDFGAFAEPKKNELPAKKKILENHILYNTTKQGDDQVSPRLLS